MFWIVTTSKVGYKSVVEVLENGKCMLTAESGEEGIKIFLGLDDDDRVNEGRCRGILNNGASVVAGCRMGVCIEVDVIDTYVEVKVSYN